MFDNELNPFFDFLCSYKPQNDGFIIDGVYYRWVKDYVRYACPKTYCCNCLIVAEDEDCIGSAFVKQNAGGLRHLYAAYLINHEYGQDRINDALRVFEENQDILEFMFSWLKQDYTPYKAFFNFSKYLGALHDWGYKLEAVQKMNYWETYAEFLSEYKPSYEGFELCGVHYYDLSHLLHKVCKEIDQYACIVCPVFKEIGLKGEKCWHNHELSKSNKLKVIYLSWLLMEREELDGEITHDIMMDFDKNWVAATVLFSYINDERYKMVYTSALGWQVKDLKMKDKSGAYAAPPGKQETTWPLDQSYSELDANVKVMEPTDPSLSTLKFSEPLTRTMDTEGIDEEKLAKILREEPLGAIALEENKTRDKDLVGMMAEAVAATKEKISDAVESTGLFKGVKEVDSECTMSLKVHKALKEKPTDNGAYWCACADVMDGNILEKCFWREVTFFNGNWCVDDGTLVLAWMALPPSQNPKDFL